MKSFTGAFLVCLVGALGIESCVSHNYEPPVIVDCTDSHTISFSTEVQPILQSNCAIPHCHNGDNGADINWTDPVKFKAHSDEARRRVLLPKSHSDHMPREGEISYEQISRIVCWAEQGAPIDN
jgi:hypothetical protein